VIGKVDSQNQWIKADCENSDFPDPLELLFIFSRLHFPPHYSPLFVQVPMMPCASLSSNRDADEVAPCWLDSICRHSGRVLRNFQGQAIHVDPWRYRYHFCPKRQ